jgi:hypothetical protein
VKSHCHGDQATEPAAAVIGVGGALPMQFHLIDGVEAVIPAAIEPVLAALPGIAVTPDVSVGVQDMPESTGPYTEGRADREALAPGAAGRPGTEKR